MRTNGRTGAQAAAEGDALIPPLDRQTLTDRPWPYYFKARVSFSPLGDWNDDDFDVLADGVVVGRIFKANAAPLGQPWMWTACLGGITKTSRPRTATPRGVRGHGSVRQ